MTSYSAHERLRFRIAQLRGEALDAFNSAHIHAELSLDADTNIERVMCDSPRCHHDMQWSPAKVLPLLDEFDRIVQMRNEAQELVQRGWDEGDVFETLDRIVTLFANVLAPNDPSANTCSDPDPDPDPDSNPDAKEKRAII